MVLYRRPPDGQWARTGTVDSSIVRFLLPIGGAALLRLPWRLPFHIKKNDWGFIFRSDWWNQSGRWLLLCMFLYESLTNILELKDFRFSLWQVFLPCMLYEKVAFKSTSAEPLPRRAIGTGQLSRLRFRAGPIARRGGAA